MTHAAGWTLWTMTFTLDGVAHTTDFWAPSQMAARAYGHRWCLDYTTETGRECRMVAVGRK